MGFKCGIVGLPNVGKSTLFNALTQTAAAQAANYPFCTIEPNVGDVAVPDERLSTLCKIAGSKEIIPTRLTFVDIAGLVRGASKGEGLGNQFLANIREVDAIAHVVRCFEDGDITHVEGKIDPIADIDTIETELMLADLDSLEKRVTALEKKAKGGDKESKEALDLVNRSLVLLREGKPARLVERSTKRKSCSRRWACSPPSRCSMSATSRRPAPTRATPSPPRCSSAPPRKASAPWSSRPRSRARSR
jgi:GTP-binding protein YchF